MNIIQKLMGVAVCTTFAITAMADTHTLNVTVDNANGTERKDEPVVVNLKDIKKLKFDVIAATVQCDGVEVPCQLDDMNGDGVADELVWVCDLAAKNKKTFAVTLTNEKRQSAYTPRVYADMMLDDKKGKHPLLTSIETPGSSYIYSDMYHHGPAFESELTAYRIYFDKRQNIDLYGKRKRQLEIQETHFYATQKHLDAGYGCDVLWAGSAIGCGTLRPWTKDGKMGDWNNVDKRRESIISAGPVRTVVEVVDMGFVPSESAVNPVSGPNGEVPAWKQMPEKKWNIRTRYILYAGHRDLCVEVKADKPLDGLNFCTGVQKVGVQPDGLIKETGKVAESTVGHINDDGIAASWGADYPEMGKKDLFKPETVGLAVYVPQKYIKEKVTDDLNYLYIIGADGKKTMRYYVSFCAAKEEQGYATADAWFASLPAWKERLSNKVKVKIGK